MMATQQTDERLQPGAVVAGKYLVEGPLGEGGFASVYAARHNEIASLRFAIKVLHTEHTHDPRVRGRFRKEAETVAALTSRNIVRVVDIGEFPDQRPYIVMEFIDGRPLDGLLKTCGRLSPGDVARLSIDVLKALEVAHGRGIVHRDLKPANVFAVQEPDEPIAAKVLDFGIAKVVNDAGGATFAAGTHTVAGNVVCTPQYAAPELLTGKTSPLVDLYALGHMMAELLEGRAPYEHLGNPLLIAAEHLRPDPVPLGAETQRSGLASVIAQACAKDEAARFQSARAMLEALRAATAALPAPGPALSLSQPYRLATMAIPGSAPTQPEQTTTFARPAPPQHTPTLHGTVSPTVRESAIAAPPGEVPPPSRPVPGVLAGVAAALVIALGIGLVWALSTGGAGATPDALTPAQGQPAAISPSPEQPPAPSSDQGAVGLPVAAPAPMPDAAVPEGEGSAASPSAAGVPDLAGSVPNAPPAAAEVAPPVVEPADAAAGEAGLGQPPEATPRSERRPARATARPTPEPEPVPIPAAPEPSPAPQPAAEEPAAPANPFGNIEIRR